MSAQCLHLTGASGRVEWWWWCARADTDWWDWSPACWVTSSAAAQHSHMCLNTLPLSPLSSGLCQPPDIYCKIFWKYFNILQEILSTGWAGVRAVVGGDVSWQERNQFSLLYRCTALVPHLYTHSLPATVAQSYLSPSLTWPGQCYY